MRFLGIDHPAVAADDVEKLSDWYCNMLGYEKWFKHPKPVWMLKAPDGTLLEVMPKDDTLRQTRTTWTPGWSHLALRVENIEEAVTYLDSKGIVWVATATQLFQIKSGIGNNDQIKIMDTRKFIPDARDRKSVV